MGWRDTAAERLKEGEIAYIGGRWLGVAPGSKTAAVLANQRMTPAQAQALRLQWKATIDARPAEIDPIILEP